jgi:hypothetical protein
MVSAFQTLSRRRIATELGIMLASFLFRRATQNGSHCSPRPRSRSGLFGLSPNRRTPCGRRRVPRQRSALGYSLHSRRCRTPRFTERETQIAIVEEKNPEVHVALNIPEVAIVNPTIETMKPQ